MFPIVTVTCFLVRLENLGCGVHLTIALGVGWRAARVGVVVTGTCGFRVAGACDRVRCAIGWHLGADSRRGIFLLCCAGVLAGALGWCISGGMAVTSSCTACFSARVCRSSHTALSLVPGAHLQNPIGPLGGPGVLVPMVEQQACLKKNRIQAFADHSRQTTLNRSDRFTLDHFIHRPVGPVFANCSKPFGPLHFRSLYPQTGRTGLCKLL